MNDEERIELSKDHEYVFNDMPYITENFNSAEFPFDRVKNLDLYFNNSQGYGEQIEFLNFTPFPITVRTTNGPAVTIQPEKISHDDADGCLVVRHGIRADQFQKNEIRANNAREATIFENPRYNAYDYLKHERLHSKSSGYEIGSIKFDTYSYMHFYYRAEDLMSKFKSSKNGKIIIGKPVYAELSLELDPLLSTSHPLDHYAIIKDALSKSIDKVKKQYVKYDSTSFQVVINDKTNTVGKRFINLFGKIVEVNPVSNACEKEGVSIFVAEIRDGEINSEIKMVEGFPQGLEYISEKNGFYRSKQDCIDGYDLSIIKKRHEIELARMKRDHESSMNDHELELTKIKHSHEVAMNNHKEIISSNQVTISDINKEINELKCELEKMKSENERIISEKNHEILMLKSDLELATIQLKEKTILLEQKEMDLKKEELNFKQEDLGFKYQDRKDEREFKEKEKKLDSKNTKWKSVTDTLKNFGSVIVAVGGLMTAAIGFTLAYWKLKKDLELSPK